MPHQKRVGVVGAYGLEQRNVGGDAGHFLAAQLNHLLMVGGVGGDGAGGAVLFQTAYAVSGTLGSGNRPVACQGLGVALVGAPASLLYAFFGQIVGPDGGIFVGVGYAPGR